MYYKLYGRDLAMSILNEIKEQVILRKLALNRVPMLKIICKDKTNPFYKGLVKDAEYCGIDICDGWFDHADGTISLEKDYPLFSLLHPENNADLYDGYPCVVQATRRLLQWHGLPITGKKVCVIGRTEQVGLPMAELFTKLGATVMICHTQSDVKDVQHFIYISDFVISAASPGVDLLETYDFIKEDQTIVDLGGNFSDERCLFVENLVPFVGGVGPITRAMVMLNVFGKAYKEMRISDLTMIKAFRKTYEER